MKYTIPDSRTGNILYRRNLPDGSKFVRSFKTSDPKIAGLTYWKVDAEFNSRAEQQRVRESYLDKNVRREVYWGCVARWIEHERKSNGGTLPRPARVDLPTETRFVSHTFLFVKDRFLGWASQHAPEAVQIFEMGDATTDELFFTGVVGAYFTASEGERLGRAKSTPAVEPKPLQSQILASGEHSLDDLFAAWVREQRPEVSSQNDMRRALDIFRAANPECGAIERIGRPEVKRFREALSLNPMSPVTKNKRLAHLSALMSCAMKQFWVDQNPVVGVRFDVRHEDRTEREGFEPADIGKWMQHPVFSQHKFGFYGWSEYWAPLLCIWTGARRNEIGQLERADIHQVDGCWVIEIGGGGKTVKNAGSRRQVPVHPKLIKCGLLKWIAKQPEGRLFGNLPIEKDGQIGTLSSIVRDQLDQVGLPNLSLHSTRHGFRTAARTARCDREVVDKLLGHAGRTAGERYGDVTLATKAEQAARIEMGALPKPFRD